MHSDLKPRRSVLYVPGDNPRALRKAAALPTDALILDLEDAVPPAAKEAAREAACRAAGSCGRREVAIRVNGLNTDWGRADLVAAATSGADAVLLPKVNGPGELRDAAAILAAAGAPDSLRLWAMAETAAGIQRIAEICAADPGPAVVVMGTNDLATALRLPRDPERTGLRHALAACVLAARAQGIDIIDGVYANLTDEAGFVRECEQGRALGFDGKSLIHPRQIEPANAAFGVTAEELGRSEAIVAAWEAASAAGRGVAVLDGRMIEELHANAARRVLALHAVINASAED